jgi:hypothetical protein
MFAGNESHDNITLGLHVVLIYIYIIFYVFGLVIPDPTYPTQSIF